MYSSLVSLEKQGQQSPPRAGGREAKKRDSKGEGGGEEKGRERKEEVEKNTFFSSLFGYGAFKFWE